MIHFYSDYDPKNESVSRCIGWAKASWQRQRWIEKPIRDEQLPRLFAEDGKKLPYLKDLIDAGVEGAADDEIIVYTNSDIQVLSTGSLLIAIALQETDACFCFRRDFAPKIELVADADYTKGHDYSGSDLYAFRAAWWRKNKLHFPDMVTGYELFDPLLRHVITKTSAPNRFLLKNLIAHEKDGNSWWEKPENRYKLKGQIHNLTLGSRWMVQNGVNPASHGVPKKFYENNPYRQTAPGPANPVGKIPGGPAPATNLQR